jgi:hypothetical protein
MKARFDLATMIGWHGEAFARTKTVKPLSEYLKPPLAPEDRRRRGAERVREMLIRMESKQKKKGAGDGAG